MKWPSLQEYDEIYLKYDKLKVSILPTITGLLKMQEFIYLYF
jgi:hypothetical protein